MLFRSACQPLSQPSSNQPRFDASFFRTPLGWPYLLTPLIPLAEIGTDPHRNRHWSQRSAEAFNHFADGYPWGFHQFRASDGYLSPLLDGVWLRAPFLHNGSVQSLREILQPAASRSKTFQRGCDTYDQASLGFLCTEQGAFQYDTSIPGNGNSGHEYGTALIDSEKQALLEYLKTL